MALSLSHNPQPKYECIKLHFFCPRLIPLPQIFFMLFWAGRKFFFVFVLINRLDTLLPPPSAESLFCASPSSSEVLQNKSQILWHSNIFLCSHRLCHFEDSIFCVESPSLLSALMIAFPVNPGCCPDVCTTCGDHKSFISFIYNNMLPPFWFLWPELFESDSFHILKF